MDFKKISLRSILFILGAAIFLIFFVVMGLSSNTNRSVTENTLTSLPEQTTQDQSVQPAITRAVVPDLTKEDSAVIQQQLDLDRQQQKHTKDLKIKLEQINLELEQEKAIAEISKLKGEDRGIFNEPAIDGQRNLPEVKVDYIGGNSVKKEAILSIGGVSYQVKEKSNPTDNIQVVSISDSSVTLHFSGPQDLIKDIEYKPE